MTWGRNVNRAGEEKDIENTHRSKKKEKRIEKQKIVLFIPYKNTILL